MSACTRLASASASALEMVSKRFCSTSTLVRSSSAVTCIFLTWNFCSASIRAVDVSSAALTDSCSWFSSARFLRPCSMTMVCSFLRLSSSKSMSHFRWISPSWYSCSRFAFSMAFRSSVVRSRLVSSSAGKMTRVTVQLEKVTPASLNFLFSVVSRASERLPRSMRTVPCDWLRTSTRMASSTAPDRSWSKRTAPNLYTKS
mmetsp:Transcript_107352/g.299054  ORF Transcript_107352/g.299054 Transcript_107352/m.299054 type:complete len:201 (+) Transcript_107352:389-991(+)